MSEDPKLGFLPASVAVPPLPISGDGRITADS